jgi:hypothetical protein
MDDQLARCMVAEEEGWGYVVENRTQENIQSGIQKLLNHSGQGTPIMGENGAETLSKALSARLEVKR